MDRAEGRADRLREVRTRFLNTLVFFYSPPGAEPEGKRLLLVDYAYLFIAATNVYRLTHGGEVYIYIYDTIEQGAG